MSSGRRVSVSDDNKLHRYCRRGEVKKVKSFLELQRAYLDRHLNRRVGVFGYTPLHEACLKGHHSILEMLLEYGGEVDVRSNTGYTPLHVAATSGHVQCVRILLKHGANIQAIDDFKKTPRETAQQCRHFNVVKALRTEEVLQAAANALKNVKDLTDLLVQLGSEDVDEGCFEQALLLCVRHGDLGGVGKLLLKGAKNWDNGINVAVSRFHFSVAALLLLSKAAGEGNMALITDLFKPTDNLSSLRRDDDVGHARWQIAEGAIESVAHVPIKVGMRKKQYDAVLQLLLHTDCDVSAGRADWRGLALKEIRPEWFKAIGPWGKRLSFMSNFLTILPGEVGCLERVQRLNLAHNNLVRIPSVLVQLPQLRSLNISNNKLSELPQNCEWTGTMTVLNLASNSLKSLPSGIQNSNLKQIRIAHNPMSEVPRAVSFCEKLESLDISHTEIAFLPNEMGRLVHLTELSTDGLEIDDPNPSIVKNPKDCIEYLRQRLRGAEPYYKMKMMIVGYAARGKTTLVGRLQNIEVSHLSTVGIELSEWSHALTVLGQRFTFQIWDFGGQEEYYATHQCFLSSRSLYLVVWRLTDGEDGIKELELWLDNIAARAPESPIIIVGTFLDKLTPKERKNNLHVKLLEKANELTAQPRYRKLDVVGLVSVSCEKETVENIEILKKMIYEAAAEAQVGKTKVMGERVPSSYVALDRRLTRQRAKMLQKDTPPIMTRQELRAFVRRSKSTVDISNDDELDAAVRFQHQIGSLLHFDDASGRLSNLYFVDSRWLCDMMSTVITVRERNPYIKNGILQVSSLPQLFKNRRFPPDLLSEYLSLLNRFEIALPLDKGHILIPSMLPSNPSDDVPLLFSSSPVLSRQHSMAYVPPGFWSRLIARLLTFIKDLVIWLPPDETADKMTDIAIDDVTTVSSQNDADSENHVDGELEKQDDGVCENKESHSNSVSSTGSGNSSSEPKSGRRQSDLVSSGGSAQSTVSELRIHGRPSQVGGDGQWSDADVSDEEKESLDVAAAVDDESEWGLVFRESHFDERRHQSSSKDSKFAVRTGSGFSSASRESARRRQVNQVMSKTKAGSDLEVLQKYKLTYWQTGLCFSHRHLFFMVRKLEDDILGRSGIETVTSSGENGQRALGRLVDHINRLVEEWFPGLDGTDGRLPLVTQLCPCIECKRLGIGEPHVFRYETECLEALPNSPTIGCPKHKTAVQLVDLVPELFLTDINQDFLLFESDVRADKDEDNLLGRGGFGEVYRGYCRGETVAVKTYLASVGLQNEPARQFKEIRQEVMVLQKVSHPNLVGMVGVCLHPLFLVLDLAPLGSLSTFIKSQGPIHRVVIHKIAGQVAAALAYLHNQSIIFRDLKAGNVLVWSLDVEADINVKLTDYGIATFAAPSGLKGFEGTKGFQAPEMIRFSGTEEYTCMVDIYAFAMFLYQIIARRPPFHNYVEVEVTPAILQGRRPILSDIPVAHCGLLYLSGLMKQCWSENPRDRVSADAIASLVYNPSFVCTLCAAHLETIDEQTCHACILNDSQMWVCSKEPDAIKVHVFRLKRLTEPVAKFSLASSRCLHMSSHLSSVWIGVAADSSKESCYLYEYRTDKQDQPSLVKKYSLSNRVTSLCVIPRSCHLIVGHDTGTIQKIQLSKEPSKSSNRPEVVDVGGKYAILALFHFGDDSIWCISKRYLQIFSEEDLLFEGMWTHPTIDSPIAVAKASPDMKLLWCSYTDTSTLSAWNTTEKHTLFKDIVLDDAIAVSDFSLSADDMAWIAMEDGRILAVEIQSGQVIHSFQAYSGRIGQLLSVSESGPCGTECGLMVSVGQVWNPFNPLGEVMLPKTLFATNARGSTVILWDALRASELRKVVELSQKAEANRGKRDAAGASSVLRYTDSNEWATAMEAQGDYAANGPVSAVSDDDKAAEGKSPHDKGTENDD